jgi:hypothetical protein
MPERGWRKHWRDGSARVQAANLAELDRRLEGPGAERRLQRIRARFRRALAEGHPRPLNLGILCALVFLAVVALGLVFT